MTKPKIKITYSGRFWAASPELHQMFDEAVAQAKGRFGTSYPMFINGEERFAGENPRGPQPDQYRLAVGPFPEGRGRARS